MIWERWFKKRNVYTVIGLWGVSEKESKHARHWGVFFNYAIVLIAITLLVQWQLDLSGKLTAMQELFINWIVWLFFVAEFIVLLALVKSKLSYVKNNWMLPVIILGGLPFLVEHTSLMVLLRGLRPFLAIFILVPALKILASFFIDGRLRTTLLAGLIIVVVFGILVAGVDPNIKTFWDGIWWALATVSTVGYGDVVPSSALGRLIGAGLVVLGLGVFVVLTANFLALTLRREAKKFKKEEKQVAQILEQMKQLSESQQAMAKVLNRLARKIEPEKNNNSRKKMDKKS